MLQVSYASRRNQTHYFLVFPMVPQSLLFVGPYRRLCDTLEAYEWDLSRLDAHTRVLAYCVMAVTARISTHPMLIGADVTDARILQFLSSGDLSITPGLDLRELGRNRNAFCRRLYDEACKLAFSTGVSVISSEETAASCYLLHTKGWPVMPCNPSSTSLCRGFMQVTGPEHPGL